MLSWGMLPALIAGLAYHLSVKNPEAMDRVALLKQIYEECRRLSKL
jgi:hypothetical protein